MARLPVQRGAITAWFANRPLAFERLESRSMLAADASTPDLGDAAWDGFPALVATVTDAEVPSVDEASTPPGSWTTDENGGTNPDSDVETGDPYPADLDTEFPIEGCLPEGWSLQICPMPVDLPTTILPDDVPLDDPGTDLVSPEGVDDKGIPTSCDGLIEHGSVSLPWWRSVGDVGGAIAVIDLVRVKGGFGCGSFPVEDVPGDGPVEGGAIEADPVSDMLDSEVRAESLDSFSDSSAAPTATASPDDRQASPAGSVRSLAAFAGVFASSSSTGQTDQPTGSGRRGIRR